MTWRIAVLDDWSNVAHRVTDWSNIEPHASVRFFTKPIPHADLATALAPFHILCLTRDRTPFSRATLEALPNLKAVVMIGTEMRNFDFEAAAERRVEILQADIAGGDSPPGATTAEMVWALILALAKRIPSADRDVREGRWQTAIGLDIHGRTLGLIGLGRVGGRTAEIARAFGMNILAWTPNLTEERAAKAGARLASKETILRDSDIVSLHAPGVRNVPPIIGAAELALMKPSAFLVNTARAVLVDHAALIAALKNGQIAGAGLDVYEREPLPADDPILQAPNLVLTPHLGFLSEEVLARFNGGFVKALERYLPGKPAPNP